MFVDYRKLTIQVTKKVPNPLSRIDDTLDTFWWNSLFSTLDLESGYWQVDTHSGLYENLVLPLGFTKVSSTFEILKTFC